MTNPRLSLALASGAVTLPDTGRILILRPTADIDTDGLPQDRCLIVHGFRPEHDAWEAAGWQVAPTLPEEEAFAAAIVCLPRSKTQARAMIARAASCAPTLIIDGQKTDGIDSLLKDLRKRGEAGMPFSKAHGKTFAFAPAEGTLDDWQTPDFTRIDDGWITAPGVFSADAPDPGSVQLAQAFGEQLNGRVVDLGAGWGYLAPALLRNEKLRELVLVEAEYAALEAARQNITDPRVRFEWADATRFSDATPFDHVVTNPPFHISRAADPSLGAGFIAAAARLLKPAGALWLVANRHLPYEKPLSEAFTELRDLGGDTRFKLYLAKRPLKRGAGGGSRQPR